MVTNIVESIVVCNDQQYVGLLRADLVYGKVDDKIGDERILLKLMTGRGLKEGGGGNVAPFTNLLSKEEVDYIMASMQAPEFKQTMRGFRLSVLKMQG
ncbi:hypothetical protein MAR_032926 [Mya arenaria]|uniref:Uncharacterized protein n=1 Tax=Mya arenaria TaxID=6604 RepID=A0ABY7GAL1_MYAAR|nr:hypothetical protein MAR_032926 [Mya arenaria]